MLYHTTAYMPTDARITWITCVYYSDSCGDYHCLQTHSSPYSDLHQDACSMRSGRDYTVVALLARADLPFPVPFYLIPHYWAAPRLPTLYSVLTAPLPSL